MNNFLSIKSNMFRRRVIANRLFPIYMDHDETLEHVLLGCAWNEKVWFMSNLCHKHDLRKVTHFEGWFQETFFETLSPPNDGDNILALLCFIICYIWLARNRCAFFSNSLKSFLGVFCYFVCQATSGDNWVILWNTTGFIGTS